MLYLHISVVQGSMAHSSNNLGVLYQTLHCGADIDSTSLIVGDLDSFFKKDYDAKPWHKTEVH